MAQVESHIPITWLKFWIQSESNRVFYWWQFINHRVFLLCTPWRDRCWADLPNSALSMCAFSFQDWITIQNCGRAKEHRGTFGLEVYCIVDTFVFSFPDWKKVGLKLKLTTPFMCKYPNHPELAFSSTVSLWSVSRTSESLVCLVRQAFFIIYNYNRCTFMSNVVFISPDGILQCC